MQRLMLVVFALILSVHPTLAADEPVKVKAGKTAGTGYLQLEFTGEPDERGLIWSLQEPLRTGDYWAVSVLNTSKKSISELCVRIEIQIEGTWYLSGMGNARMLLTPYKVGPDEFAITAGDQLSSVTDDWDEARIVPCEKGDLEIEGLVDLKIESLGFLDGKLNGKVVNSSKSPVRDILIYYHCVNSEGLIYESSFFDIEIRKLDPGQSELFEESRVDCVRASDVIADAIATARS